jgi:hypothetical protein
LVPEVSLIAPAALLWLIPLAGIIIALYLLKMRRRDVRVPATFLWPAMTYEIRANALFQKLKFSWLMVLQLLALAAIVFALARPQMLQRGLGGAVTVVVIDTSASMSATDVKPSRFGEAIRQAEGLISRAQSTDRIAVIEAGSIPRVVAALSGEPSRLRRALGELRPTDAEGDVGEALRLAASLAANQPSARIVLLSDGVFPEVANFSPGKAEVVFPRIGTSGENVAISAFAMADTPRGRELFYGVRNFGREAAGVRLQLFADGKLFDSKSVELKPQQTVGETVRAPAGAKLFEAKLESGDALAADDYAVALSDPGASVRVLLVTTGNLFLERALTLEPRVVLDKSATVPTSGEWDVAVLDGITTERIPARTVLRFGASGRGLNLRKPTFADASSGQPLLRGVDLSDVYVDVAESGVAPAGAQVVAEFQGGTPAIMTRQASGRREVIVGFRPLDSDFPLQVGFPIFLANALEWLVPPSSRGTTMVVSAGRTISLPAPSDAPVTLKGPARSLTLNPTNGSVLLRDLRTVGKYEIGKRTLHVILRSDLESAIAPQDRVVLGGTPIASTNAITRFADLWRWVALLGLFILAGEWWLFARRS